MGVTQRMLADQVSLPSYQGSSVVELCGTHDTKSLPPEETSYSLPPKGTSYSLPPEGASYSLPPEGTSCSLHLEGTSYSLPLEETSYSLVIASGPEVAFVTPAIPVDRSNIEWFSSRDLGLIPSGIGFVRRVSVEGAHPEGLFCVSTGGHKARLEGLGSLVGSLFGSSRIGLVHSVSSGVPRPEVIGFIRGGVALNSSRDMHAYVSRLKDTELETLIATYDIPLDLRPRLPDLNFRMINLPAKDIAIGMYSRIFDSSGVRIPFSTFLLVVLKYFKVHISQQVPLGLSKVITFEARIHRIFLMDTAYWSSE
ncbi:hypothetical protein Tco_0162030 [Tanacetum coccineum]